MENVAVVGASPKIDRYSNQAMRLLEACGHVAIPVAPARKEILGKAVYSSLAAVPDRIDTITLYVSPPHQAQVLEDAVKMKPRRIIFNPGTENSAEYGRLREVGIEVLEACTLILLRTNQF